jgi:hypothetical protein
VSGRARGILLALVVGGLVAVLGREDGEWPDLSDFGSGVAVFLAITGITMMVSRPRSER